MLYDTGREINSNIGGELSMTFKSLRLEVKNLISILYKVYLYIDALRPLICKQVYKTL